MVFHVLSSEADLIDMFHISNGGDIAEAQAKLENLTNDEIVVFMTDFLFELTDDFIDMLKSLGFSSNELQDRIFQLSFLKI